MNSNNSQKHKEIHVSLPEWKERGREEDRGRGERASESQHNLTLHEGDHGERERERARLAG